MKVRVLLAIAGLVPWLGPWAPGAVRAELYLLFAPLCHQRPERTLVLAGCAMSVCSRCAGVYAGLTSGALLAWPKMRSSRWRAVLRAACLVMLADILTQDLAIHPVWHAARLATGGLVGYAASAWMTGELTA